jgi:uncharacterized cupin superfamily protein
MTAPSQAHPIKLSKSQFEDQIFNGFDPEVVVQKFPEGELTTKKVELFKSGDDKTRFGIFSESAYSYEFAEAFGNNEYMYFVDGSVTLTSADGTVTNIEAGDAIFLPAEWKGTWATPGYTKVYLTIAP